MKLFLWIVFILALEVIILKDGIESHKTLASVAESHELNYKILEVVSTDRTLERSSSGEINGEMVHGLLLKKNRKGNYPIVGSEIKVLLSTHGEYIPVYHLNTYSPYFNIFGFYLTYHIIICILILPIGIYVMLPDKYTSKIKNRVKRNHD